MSGKRALVDCAVLSLQDSCVFYPCCKGCFSKVDADSTDTRRTCPKCGYRCARDQLYRYRLSLRVARGSCIFGVTVFGNCLNPFFGIHANGLQRLVADNESLDPLFKSTMLVKAVEECFIGKHFIFGIKVTESENEPWMGRSIRSCSNDMAQVIATQMILPKAAGLRGCTVLNYYETVFRNAAENKLTISNAFKTFQPQEKPPLSVNQNSPAAFTNDTLCSPRSLLLSLSRSQHQDRSLSPTPPWHQTLGLITSSAEQEETQNSDNGYPSFIDKDDRIAIALNPLFDISPAHKRTGVKDISTADITESILTTTIDLEDYPLSESLTKFLNQKNRPESLSQENTFSVDSISICRKKIQTANQNSNVSHSHREADHYDAKTHANDIDNVGSVDRSQTGYFSSSDVKKPNTEANFESNEDEPASIYNCSADLFIRSPKIDMDMTLENLQLPASTGYKNVSPQHTRLTEEASSLLSLQKPFSEKVEKHSTTDDDKAKRHEHSLRESFPFSTNLTFDFIPPSQSTPAETGTVQKRKCVRANLLTKSANRTSYCLTPKSRYRKPDKRRYVSARRGVLNTKPTVYTRRSSGFQDKDELIVPPTPTIPMTSSLKINTRNYSLELNSVKDNTQSECRYDSVSADCETVEGNECNIANEECDWSQDLFSDSV